MKCLSLGKGSIILLVLPVETINSVNHHVSFAAVHTLVMLINGMRDDDFQLR